MDSTHQIVTGTPVDLVAGLSLAAGNYLLRNESGDAILCWLRDAVAADVGTLDPANATRLLPAGQQQSQFVVEIEAGNAVYVATSSGESCRLWVADA